MTFESKENEPMQVTVVLRGRRKKREIKPNEVLRVSREEPLFWRIAASPMVMPSDSALTDQKKNT